MNTRYFMDRNHVIRFDWAMKRMLRNKANFAVLEGLLTVLMGEQIKIEELLESEGNQQTIYDKYNRVDIKARDSKGDIIIFEIQNTREIYFLERILYGVAKAITEHISLGSNYSEVKKIISVSIVYFNLGEGKDYVYHGQNKFIGIHTHDELKINTRQKEILEVKGTEDIFPEYFLLRVNNFNKVAKTPLEEWMEYLKTGTISQQASAPGLQEARERLRLFSMSDEERHDYEKHLNDIMIENDVMRTSHDEGFAEGRVEGEHRKAIDIAHKMKLAGIPVSQIASITGLQEKEIELL